MSQGDYIDQFSHSPTLPLCLSNIDHKTCTKSKKKKKNLFNVATIFVFALPLPSLFSYLHHIGHDFFLISWSKALYKIYINYKRGRFIFSILYGNCFSKIWSYLVASKRKETIRVEISKTCYFPTLYRLGWLLRSGWFLIWHRDNHDGHGLLCCLLLGRNRYLLLKE